jgi:hypothetical protein
MYRYAQRPTNLAPTSNITNENGDCNGDKETAAMTSEASIPEPPNVFIYNKDTKDDIPDNVTHVKVDPSVKEIHDKAFEACLLSLVEVEFSEGLQVIGDRAFIACRDLKYINKLPSTLKEIGVRAFKYCESLDSSIEFPEGLQVADW